MELQRYLYKHFAKRTAHGYALMIEHYCNQASDPEKAKHKDVLNYLEKQRQNGKQSRTLQAYLSAIKVYYDYLKQSGRRPDHPCKHMRLKDRIDPRIHVQDLFSSTELELLLEQSTSNKPNLVVRDKVILTLLIYQGLTTKNIINLEVKEINLEQATVYIKGAAELTQRTLELHPKQIMLISRYLNEERSVLNKNHSEKLIITRKGNPETGCAVRWVIAHHRHLFPNKNLSALAIRQSVIANLLKAGKDIRSVQVFAGHRSPMTTERYQQSGIEELTAAVMKFHPLK